MNRDESFKLDGIVVDILSIALPAALALAADPITSLVDTAFVGHLGNTLFRWLRAFTCAPEVLGLNPHLPGYSLY